MLSTICSLDTKQLNSNQKIDLSETLTTMNNNGEIPNDLFNQLIDQIEKGLRVWALNPFSLSNIFLPMILIGP